MQGIFVLAEQALSNGNTRGRDCTGSRAGKRKSGVLARSTIPASASGHHVLSVSSVCLRYERS
jgi:hypothetical protein